ncbi:LacI family DNA-binding transcriptional regulator [Kribbella sp. NPDC051620]|uniref:LacI family DNA-binding transcriptional regulator n=1 Tax=Kribbella sp. NPDC051620 TaxID=3364120 RepID=UPI0037B9DF8B
MNIGEIARLAGVSRSTVSYVLSGKRQVSPDLHRRVTEVIEASGYRPSATARALAEGTTRTIGLAIPPLGGHLSVDQLHFVGAVSEAAADAGYDVLLSPSGEQRRPAFDRIIEQRRVDGIILMETVLHDSRVAKLAAEGFPFVTIGRTGDDTHGWVDLDYSGLVAHGIEQLAAAGHRKVALINRQQDLLDHEYGPAYRAADAFGKAVVELDLDGHAECCDDDNSGADACLDRIFAVMPDVTALLTINERSLTGVVSDLQARGLRIPSDISVLAIASERNATSVSPMLSAADVPTFEMGTEAVAALLQRIAAPEDALPNRLFSPPFVDRGSVGAPA